MYRVTLLGVVAASLMLVACDSYKPVELTDQPGEMADGPGLFSGKKGEFVIPAPSRREETASSESRRGATDSQLPAAKPPAGYKPLD